MHPGEVLREDFCYRLGVPRRGGEGLRRSADAHRRLSNEETGVTADTALRLSNSSVPHPTLAESSDRLRRSNREAADRQGPRENRADSDEGGLTLSFGGAKCNAPARISLRSCGLLAAGREVRFTFEQLATAPQERMKRHVGGMIGQLSGSEFLAT